MWAIEPALGFDRPREILVHHVHVIHVELKEQIAGADVVDDLPRLRRARQKEPRHVAGVDRLDQQLDAGALEPRRRGSQVSHKCRPRRGVARPTAV